MRDGRSDGLGAMRIMAGAGLLLAVTAASGAAQQTDSRWLPFLGCWEATGEMGAPVDDALVCVRPAEDGVGVDMLGVTETGEVTARGAGRRPAPGFRPRRV